MACLNNLRQTPLRSTFYNVLGKGKSRAGKRSLRSAQGRWMWEQVAAVGWSGRALWRWRRVDKALEQGVNMTSHGGDMVVGGSRMARGVCPKQ